MKILVVQGAGMNMRGKVQTEIFGTMTMDEYNQNIHKYAEELGIEVEIVHSNIEGEVINSPLHRQRSGLRRRADQSGRVLPRLPGADGGDRPGQLSGDRGAHLRIRCGAAPYPTLRRYVWASSPGYGVYGYYLALRGLRETKKK